MLFVTYTEGATSVFDTQLVQYYLLADVTQAYDYCPVSSAPSLVTRLSSCVTDLAHSFASLRLQLNPSKTEFMVWHTSQSSQATQRVPFIDCLFVSHSVRWYRSWLRCSLLDSELSMRRHIISKVVSGVSTIWDACVRYGTVSAKTSWHNISSHVSSIVIPCSPAYMHSRWRL